jgi:hypothetical protein
VRAHAGRVRGSGSAGASSAGRPPAPSPEPARERAGGAGSPLRRQRASSPRARGPGLWSRMPGRTKPSCRPGPRAAGQSGV